MRVVWISDIHLNFVNLPQWDFFVHEIRKQDADALLLTGDISEAEDLHGQLLRLMTSVDLPIYFVLGNHDFYHGQIDLVRERVTQFCHEHDGLHYLGSEGPIRLHPDWTLVGDDGWADGRCGDLLRSPVQMNDFQLIQDFWALEKVDLQARLNALGQQSADRLLEQIHAAHKDSLNQQAANRLLVLTHVPPLREACWYHGRTADDDWAPFFVCEAMGQMLMGYCRDNPTVDVLVLCGHTHNSGFAQPLPNLKIWTAGAEYGEPSIASVLNLEQLSLPQPTPNVKQDG